MRLRNVACVLALAAALSGCSTGSSVTPPSSAPSTSASISPTPAPTSSYYLETSRAQKVMEALRTEVCDSVTSVKPSRQETSGAEPALQKELTELGLSFIGAVGSQEVFESWDNSCVQFTLRSVEGSRFGVDGAALRGPQRTKFKDGLVCHYPTLARDGGSPADMLSELLAASKIETGVTSTTAPHGTITCGPPVR